MSEQSSQLSGEGPYGSLVNHNASPAATDTVIAFTLTVPAGFRPSVVIKAILS